MKAKLPVLRTQEYLEERIQYLDMIALLTLHFTFGFGAERLKRYYRAIMDTADYYRRYDNPKEPDWGKKDRFGFGKTVMWKLKKDLMDIGFDYDAMVNEGTDDEERKGIK